MNGGRLKQKVRFFEYTYTPDGAGGQTAAGLEVLNTWAEVTAIKSERKLEALKEGLNSAYEVRIRMRKGFTPLSKYSVEYKGKEYVILKISSDEIENREWILVICNRESQGN